MNLSKKKQLAARTFNVGKSRIVFVKTRLSEIKEAITKEDIRHLMADGAITIREINGRRKVEGRKRRRGPGNIKRKVNVRKRTYMFLTRKLRKHVGALKQQGNISREDVKDLRKKIKNRTFKSKAHMKEHIGGMKK